MPLTVRHPWRVIYTRGRHEKSVADELCEQGIEVFLPLVRTYRQWSDRKKSVELPLFPNYVFLRANDSSLLKILKNKGVVKTVLYSGKPAIIQENQMKEIMKIIKYAHEPEVEFDSLQTGSNVRIKSGPFRGMNGQLVERKGKYKFSVQFDSINACVLFEVDLKNIVLKK
jgi:transcription antitermination factor NusG